MDSLSIWVSKQGVTHQPVQSPGLLEAIRQRCRVKHYSLRTEQAYVAWVWRFIRANDGRHPRAMGKAEVEVFLTRLATVGKVAASTQNQALAALLFLYREVLALDLPWMEDVVRAKRPQRVPVVLSRAEVDRLLVMLDGQVWLMASLLYGSGLRLLECLRLRVKDVDFDRNEITVRAGKGKRIDGFRCRSACAGHYSRRCVGCGCCMRRIVRLGCRACGCRRHWNGSIPTRAWTWLGTMCFLRREFPKILAVGSCAGIMWMKRCCSVQCRPRAKRRVSTSL